MNTVTIKQVNQYGSVVFKPMCHVAETFARIAGTKTLTVETLKAVKALGYTIEVKADTVKF